MKDWSGQTFRYVSGVRNLQGEKNLNFYLTACFPRTTLTIFPYLSWNQKDKCGKKAKANAFLSCKCFGAGYIPGHHPTSASGELILSGKQHRGGWQIISLKLFSCSRSKNLPLVCFQKHSKAAWWKTPRSPECSLFIKQHWVCCVSIFPKCMWMFSELINKQVVQNLCKNLWMGNRCTGRKAPKNKYNSNTLSHLLLIRVFKKVPYKDHVHIFTHTQSSHTGWLIHLYTINQTKTSV